MDAVTSSSAVRVPQVERTAAYAALLALPHCLETFGIDPGPFLAQRGFDVRDFRDWTGRLDAYRLDRLIGDCLVATGCDHFGLLVGAGVGLSAAGLVGRAARHADTVGQALQDLTMLTRMRDTVGSLHVAVVGDDVRFGFTMFAPDLCHVEHGYDMMLATMRNGMRELCGDDWEPTLAQLPRRRPRSVTPYSQHLARHVVFNATEASLVFPASTLHRRVAGADPMLRELVLRHAAADVDKREPALLADVRRAIHVGLVDRDSSRSSTAARLGMHERTLGRRLQESGTTFQTLLDETRVNLARELLQCTDATVARIATAVGYRDSTVFARAFRLHVGLTPREYRAARR